MQCVFHDHDLYHVVELLVAFLERHLDRTNSDSKQTAIEEK
jgi:hypothetical protein